MEGGCDMKNGKKLPAYKRYMDEQLLKAELEEDLLVLAHRLVKAKEDSGMDMFWNESEEKFMRTYMKYLEETAKC
jgi:hypothetical protein